MLGVRQPDTSAYGDTLTVELTKHANAHVHLSVGTMCTWLSAKNKAFTFGSTQAGTKSLVLQYPKIMYIAIEPDGSSGSDFADVEIDYWFTSTPKSQAATSSSSQCKPESRKPTFSDFNSPAAGKSAKTVLVVNGQK